MIARNGPAVFKEQMLQIFFGVWFEQARVERLEARALEILIIQRLRQSIENAAHERLL